MKDYKLKLCQLKFPNKVDRREFEGDRKITLSQYEEKKTRVQFNYSDFSLRRNLDCKFAFILGTMNYRVSGNERQNTFDKFLGTVKFLQRQHIF